MFPMELSYTQCYAEIPYSMSDLFNVISATYLSESQNTEFVSE